MIIAIDGPSGAGKSTLGKMLARELGLLYIDTGAMYRAAALAVVEAGVNTSDAEAVAACAQAAQIELAGEPDRLRVLLDGNDVTEAIRTEQITRLSSVISTIPAVRRDLVRCQREMGARGGVVLDGRDIGTVVFPQADVKFFLTAVPEARAQRRYEEDKRKEPGLSFDETLADINTRDRRDSTRADSPLAIAADAVVIDTTELSVDEVFARMMEVIRERVDKSKVQSPMSNVPSQPSTLGSLRVGAPVNLERAVTPTTRLGGHIVQGHVDGRGRFLSAEAHGGSWTVRIAYPPELARYLVFKGSVAVEGISLTIAGLTEEYFEVAIIPKTWQLTNLSSLRANDAVNLEADIIAKYVERILAVAPPRDNTGATGLTMEKLADLGFK